MMWRENVCQTCGNGHSYYGSCRPLFEIRKVNNHFDVVETEKSGWRITADLRTVASCISEEAAVAVRRLIVCC